MLERAQRLQRQFFGLGRAVAAQPCWEPPVDIVSCDQELRITLALPGVRPELLRVQLDGSRLLVNAVRAAPLDRDTDWRFPTAAFSDSSRCRTAAGICWIRVSRTVVCSCGW
jgi:HSP20 family molecular chaperone IbpA